MEMIGKSIGKFNIISKIGEGGVGEVYLGYDNQLKREVAIKVLSGEKRLNKIDKLRFTREAEILSRIEHSNICRIYDFISHDECDFLILEYIKGKDLKNVLNDGLSVDKKLEIAIQIAEVLSVAHEKDIVHRDIKPGNVMVDEKGQIKLLDFGMAQALIQKEISTINEISELEDTDFNEQELVDKFSDSGKMFLTKTGAISGTPMFMSPEQAKGKHVGTSSDLFSFGLLMQWLFTGNYPYPEDETPLQIILKVIHGKTLPIEGGLDSDLEKLIKRLKSFSPEGRPHISSVCDQLRWIKNKPRRRNKKIAVIAFFILFLITTVVSTLGYFKVKKANQKTEKALALAEVVNGFLKNMLSSANPQFLGKDVKVVDVLDFSSKRVEEEFSEYPLNQAMVYATLGDTYMGLGDFSKAKLLIDKSTNIRMKMLGEYHPDTIKSMLLQAQILNYQGEYGEAENLCRKLLKASIDLNGNDHEQTLLIMDELASVLDFDKSVEKQLESEKIRISIIEVRKRVDGIKSKSTLISMNNLASSYFRLGKYKNAELLLEETLKNAKGVLDNTHPLVLGALNNLATSLSLQKKYEKARDVYVNLIASCEKVMGKEHPNTLIVKGHMAMIEYNLKNFEESERLFRETYLTRARVLGENHPMTLKIEMDFANFLSIIGKRKEAESIYQKAAEKGNQTAKKILNGGDVESPQ